MVNSHNCNLIEIVTIFFVDLRDVIFYFGNKMEIFSSKEIYHSSFRKVWNDTNNDGFKLQKYVGSKLTWNHISFANMKLAIFNKY
jgi:hypothetical protein